VTRQSSAIADSLIESRTVTEGGFAEVKQRIARIQGWLGDAEAKALYDAARACTGRGAILEIGSWKGKSTICLASGSRDGPRATVYAVDLHRDKSFERFCANVERAGVADLVRPIRAPSQDESVEISEPIELLFVDGAHDDVGVQADFDRWVPQVVEGGMVFFHDTVWHGGPRRLVGREVYRSRRFADVRFIRPSTTAGRKVAENDLSDRVTARAQLAKKSAFWLASAPARRFRSMLPQPVLALGRRVIGV
jgi:predicted O-methyltransferase YrrM